MYLLKMVNKVRKTENNRKPEVIFLRGMCLDSTFENVHNFVFLELLLKCTIQNLKKINKKIKK